MIIKGHSFSFLDLQFSDHKILCSWIGAGENCEAALGYVAVYRLGFAVSAYHFLLMLITCGMYVV